MWPFDGIKIRNQIKTERLQSQLAMEISHRQVNQQIQGYVESLPTWAKDNDESAWTSYIGQRIPNDYTEQDIQNMQVKALNLSYRPGARAIIATLENFVIGQESQITVQDENPQVQDFWDEWYESSNWDMKDKESFRRYIRDGELFNRFFSPKSRIPLDGNQWPHLLTRFVEPLEIKNWPSKQNATFGIETDPEDVETVLRYYRSWVDFDSKQHDSDISPKDMIHFKIGVDSNVKRGLTHLIGAAEYIVKYEQWLDDRIKINKIATLYGLFGKIDNPATDMTAIANKLNQDTSSKTKSGDGTAKKMLQQPGVMLTKGIEWSYGNPDIRARDTKEDGRNIQLYTAAAVQLAEYVVSGDASNSNFASTMVSESPMVKAFEAMRDIQTRYTNRVANMVIGYGIKTGMLPATSTKTVTKAEANKMREIVRECKNLMEDSEKGLTEKVINAITEKSEPVQTSTKITREYPPLIHRDILKESQALQIQMLNNLVSERTASSQLGYDYDHEKELMDQDETERDEKDEKESKERW